MHQIRRACIAGRAATIKGRGPPDIGGHAAIKFRQGTRCAAGSNNQRSRPAAHTGATRPSNPRGGQQQSRGAVRAHRGPRDHQIHAAGSNNHRRILTATRASNPPGHTMRGGQQQRRGCGPLHIGGHAAIKSTRRAATIKGRGPTDIGGHAAIKFRQGTRCDVRRAATSDCPMLPAVGVTRPSNSCGGPQQSKVAARCTSGATRPTKCAGPDIPQQ